MRQLLILASLLAAGPVVAPASAQTRAAVPAPLAAAVADPRRKPENRVRDAFRHPAETLAFFGVKPGHTVVEIWPSGGWYTEILAPYLAKGRGTYWGAGFDSQVAGVRKLQEAEPARFGAVRFAGFPVFDAAEAKVPNNSADVVLTFRNVHNWRMGYQRDNKDYSLDAFRQAYAMLKPGGVLGVVDHRLPESADAERERSSGYVKVSTVRRLAEQAGFRFAGASEVNANPKDGADYPGGVWTLPPSLRGEPKEKFAAIGESDRMTLKFVKPRG